ncbi:MAG: hypothetical protein ACFFDP_04305 [Promethearchaeota archaeon]
MEEKRHPEIILYVRSFEISSGSFVDREGAQHACARAGDTPFQGLKDASHLIGRVFPDPDWKALCLAQALQEARKCEVVVIDLGKGFLRRLKLRRQGIRKTPQFVVNGQLLPPVTSLDELSSHI